jgi:hypothetical protein
MDLRNSGSSIPTKNVPCEESSEDEFTAEEYS